MKNFYIFCNCDDLGWKVSMNKDQYVKHILKDIEFEIGSQLLSVFSYNHWSENNKVLDLIEDIFKFSGSKKKKIRKKQILTCEGVLKAWEVLLEYHQYCSIKKLEIDQQIKNIIKLIVYCQSIYSNDEGKHPSELLVIRGINDYLDNLPYLISRGRFVYTENTGLKPDELALKKEMEDQFQTKYQVSLKNYCIIISSIISRFAVINLNDYSQLRKRSFYENYPLTLKKTLGSLEEYRKEVSLIMNNLCIDINLFNGFDECDENSFTRIGVKKPFYKTEAGDFIPINKKWIEDLLWISLFHKIAECYSDRFEFYNLFGHLFENYVNYLTVSTCNFRKDSYHHIPEFSYGKPIKLSPDAMISNYNRVNKTKEILVIEAKSSRVLFELKTADYSNDDIKKSLRKVVFGPLAQAKTSIIKIINAKAHDKITNENIYGIMCVSMENIPFKSFEHIFKMNLSENSDIKFVEIAVCIEEFEMLMQLLSQNGYESILKDVARYLFDQNNQTRYSELLSFKNYLNRHTDYKHIIKMPGTMQQLHSKYGYINIIDVIPKETNTKYLLEGESCY